MSGCHEIVKSFLKLGQDPNCPPQNSLESPLHLALTYKRKEVVELLLIHGADPSFLDSKGLTPLQNIIKQSRIGESYSLATMLFDCSNKKYHPLQVDTRDPGTGDTLLHLAISKLCTDTIKLLLRKGANPTIVNEEGFTPMHSICASKGHYFLGVDLLELSNKKYHPLLVSGLDKKGNSPLHLLAMHPESCFNTPLVKLLLRNGSDPNLANEEGLTPLHYFCKLNDEDCLNSIKIFFKICDELNKTIQVDARDKSGRTPLQYAVVNFMPDVVEALLDRGADLPSFVFPEKYCGEKLEWCNERVSFKLTLASGAMSVVEKLQKRGYKLDRSDALAIMKIFANYELFEKSNDFEKSWCDDEEFVREAKELTIVPTLKSEMPIFSQLMELARALNEGEFVEQSPSLYDLLHFRPEEALKAFTYDKYIKFSRFHKINLLPERLRHACMLHLCDKITKGFFRKWAVNYFWELIGYRLPIEVCDMIIDESFRNEDLYNICSATVPKSLEDGEKKVQPDEVDCVKKGTKRAKKAPNPPKAPKRRKTKK